MRKTALLEKNWRFHPGDVPGAEKIKFDDSAWQCVSVPHDWAITGPFGKNNDLQATKIVADGETKISRHFGRTGSLPHVGIGWYRRKISVPASSAGKSFRLEFDGVMSRSTVFVNGHKVGARPYGYISFFFDVTKYMIPGKENVIAVRVDNISDSSRWYPGAGIYREARFLTLEKAHFKWSGVWITTAELDVKAKNATLKIHTDPEGVSFKKDKLELGVSIISPEGENILSAKFPGPETFVCLPEIRLWSPDKPLLYRIIVSLFVNGKKQDTLPVTFGFRKVSFDAEKGMTINGRPFRMNGVCLHHDFGPLGSAFSLPSLTHRFNLLQKMGCNAIRSTHNPPDPKLLDLCDAMGFVVIDEAFDCWSYEKIRRDYHLLYDEWHVRDLTDMLLRDRNHASVILWSTGNEIIEQYHEDGWKAAKELTELCHEIDPTRPVTAGMSWPDGAIKNGMLDYIDIHGWNYKPHRYQEFHKLYPSHPMFGSETASTVSSRGIYKFPVEEGQKTYPDGQCSSYDLEYPPWASTPDKEFQFQDSCPWIMGEFVWTGFDYLGEPTPYNVWPNHSSCFGIFDLAGIPKDRAWLYAARWSGKKILHIVPHWNFPGREGEKTPVHVYTNFDRAELFVNGVSKGIRSRKGYRIIWEKVVYEPGILEVRALDPKGKILKKECVKTAGPDAKLALSADRKTFSADGHDLVFVTVSMKDAENNDAVLSGAGVSFSVSGPASIAGCANGDPRNTESFQGDSMHLFSGKLMVILRASSRPGKIRFRVTSPGVKAAQIEIVSTRQKGYKK